MQDRSEANKVRCRTGRKQDMADAGQVRSRTGQMQDRSEQFRSDVGHD